MALLLEYKDSAFALVCFLGILLLILTILAEPGQIKTRLGKATAFTILVAVALRFDPTVLTI